MAKLEIMEKLDAIAELLAEESWPSWSSWCTYLLEALESQPGVSNGDIERGLGDLRSAIDEKLAHGLW